MPTELLFDDDETHRQFIVPDETGFTLRTRYKGTQGVLDRNAALRADTPKGFKDEKGVHYHHAAGVPMELYEQLWHTLGRAPTAEELIELSNLRDYCKLKTREAKL
jgi:hypothetical protein